MSEKKGGYEAEKCKWSSATPLYYLQLPRFCKVKKVEQGWEKDRGGGRNIKRGTTAPYDIDS